MDNLYIIKDRINEALMVRNMTRNELADKSGINKGTISRYLRGETIPRSLAIGRIAKALNVNPTWILGYDVPMEGDSMPLEIHIELLTTTNQQKLLAYYEGLLDSQMED
jgi:transcriptional regulator with XRE-family HTH domain